MERGYTTEKIKIPSEGGNLSLLIFRPEGTPPVQGRTGVLWIHGGGYVAGMAEMAYFTRAITLVKKFGAVIVSPEYRLAPQYPYPAALEDCCAALVYLRHHSAELDLNSAQIGVGGESAGGGLTAAVCMWARDKGDVAVAFQMPLYPMLDNRDTPSSRDNHAPGWNTRRNHRAWREYLGGMYGGNVPCYAAPARQTDFSGLPPCYTFVGDAEPFYCETLDFVERLRGAGVDAHVDVYPGRFHAFDILQPFTRDARRAKEAFERHYAYAAEHYFAPQPEEKGART